MTIRLARTSDFEAMQEIEIEAGGMFRSVGMDAIADDEPFSVEELRAFTAAGHAWVAVDGDRTGNAAVAGYVVVELVDDGVHIEQLSVRPTRQRKGIGRSLVEHVATWAATAGIGSLTLTTFDDVPWNAPWYERLGFRRVAERDQSPGLARIRKREAAAGLDLWPRVVMMRRPGSMPGDSGG